jgi:hypothetical protein
MNKNIVIAYLAIVIAVLMGFILVSSSDLFSEVWLVGLSIILVGIVIGGVLVYFKIFRKKK